jgi:hypothetical protein
VLTGHSEWTLGQKLMWLFSGSYYVELVLCEEEETQFEVLMDFSLDLYIEGLERNHDMSKICKILIFSASHVIGPIIITFSGW